MTKFIALLVASLLMINFPTIQGQSTQTDSNQIPIEQSSYGLIYTQIQVNGEPVKAMIDFGDPYVLQLSDSFAKKQGLSLKKTDASFQDVQGNQFQVYEGTVKTLQVGDWVSNNITFQSSPGEIDGVAQQVNTDFKAVVGWGYFSKYYTLVDYANNRFTIYKEKPSIQKPLIKTSYTKDSGHLTVPALIDNEKVQLLIDTGSPVTVMDSEFMKKHQQTPFSLEIGGEPIQCDVHQQDLSVIKELGIGIIGGDILGQYQVWIDPFKSVIYLK